MGVLLLVRHGQASFGTDDYDVLSPTGWEQARMLGSWLAARGPAPDVVLRGGMRRHRETAEGLLEGSSWAAPVEVDADWDEFDHLGVVDSFPDRPLGELDRRAFQEVFEQATQRWMSGAHDGYPESFAGFQERVRAALGRAASYAGPGGSASSSPPAGRSPRSAPPWSTPTPDPPTPAPDGCGSASTPWWSTAPSPGSSSAAPARAC